MELSEKVDFLLRKALAQHQSLGNRELRQVLRLMAKWRSELLARAIAQRQGGMVFAGPFAGMRFSPEGHEGSAAAQLLGCYEHELHAVVEKLVAAAPTTIVNIGCASGYYAVGLALRLPGAEVHAFDIEPAARANCRETARLNGVAGRVIIGERFAPADFERFAGRNALVVVDIEGAELELLDPAASPALAGLTVLVECHDCFRPGVADALSARFAASHRVTRIDHAAQALKLPQWLMDGDQLDQLIAAWEWRQGPTPWLLLEPA